MSEDYLKVGNVSMNEIKWSCDTSLKPLPLYVPYPQHMTLLDHFAGLAMQGMLADDRGGALANEDLAQWAYAIANEMLKAREKKE